MVIRDFLTWLQNQEPDLTQSDIARRASLSQSVINKVLIKVGTQDAAPETYRRLTGAFPNQWRQFVEEREDVRCELYDRYAWVVGALPVHIGPPGRRETAA